MQITDFPRLTPQIHVVSAYREGPDSRYGSIYYKNLNVSFGRKATYR